MIIALSLLIVSFLAMMGMVYLKLTETRTGKSYLFFNKKSDQFVENSYTGAKKFFHRWNWRTIQLLYHLVLEKIEDFFLNIYRYTRKKFDKPVSMVKGQGDLPTEKSDSSFFLKNIEEHKNNNKPK